jgi:hypothetical protein
MRGALGSSHPETGFRKLPIVPTVLCPYLFNLQTRQLYRSKKATKKSSTEKRQIFGFKEHQE